MKSASLREIQAARTPGPWIVDHGALAMGGQVIAEASSLKPDSAPFAEGLANIEFIVRACNAHDDVVKALRECVIAINRGGGPQLGAKGADRGVIDRARAALAQVLS